VIEIHSQVKGMLAVIITAIISVVPVFIIEHQVTVWIIIGCGILLQCGLLFIPSVEEINYKKDMTHMDKIKDIDRNFDETSKAIKTKDKIKKLQEKTQKISRAEPQRIETVNFDKIKQAIERLRSK
jgi:hypothetical protein